VPAGFASAVGDLRRAAGDGEVVGLPADGDAPELERDEGDPAGGEEAILRTSDHLDAPSVADHSTLGGRRSSIVGRLADLSVSQPADLSPLRDQPIGR
jgi:hypothetical protein